MQRVADAEKALAAAQREADTVRTRIKAAEADVEAAKQRVATDNSKEARESLSQARQKIKAVQSELKPLERSERLATTEQQEAVAARDKIAKLEQELADLDAKITQLHSPGGLKTDRRSFGKAFYELGDAAREHLFRLATGRHEKLARLQDETKNLTRTIADQVNAATPGDKAKPVAKDNAAKLDLMIGDTPIDVTTGAPIPKTTTWATDHIVARARIARDPRFAWLSPAQREAMLSDIPENYLPMTAEANGSKGDLSIAEWIAARERSGQKIQRAETLLIAEKRAKAAIEAKFNQFLAP